MGASSSKIKLPEDPNPINYYTDLTTYDIDPEEQYKVKLEVRLKNIFEYKNIQIQLISYTDSKKNIKKSEGETEPGL